jgi:hypothetical protein
MSIDCLRAKEFAHCVTHCVLVIVLCLYAALCVHRLVVA